MSGESSRRDNLVLGAVALLLGLIGALGYGAWAAVSREDATSAERWNALGDAMVFPGLLIIAGVAAMVWLGWKANID